MDNTNKTQIERLFELKQLYESGILTKEEMEAEKQKILSRNNTPNISKEHNEKEEKTMMPEESTGNDSVFQKKKKYIFGGVVLIIVAIVFLVFSNLSKNELPIKEITAEPEEIDAKIVVVDEDTEEPIEGVKIKITTFDDSEVSLITDENGECAFTYTDSDAQITILRATKSGYERVEIEDYDLSKFEDDDLVIPMKKQNMTNRGQQTNIAFISESEAEKDETTVIDNKSHDDAYAYNFNGQIIGKGNLYSFRMALNIDDDGIVSGYYVVTNGANKRVMLKGYVNDWANKLEGDISLFEYDVTNNEYTGYYFQGHMSIEYSYRGSFAGYSISGSYKDDADINWPFTAE